jgi:hypothetical protein
MSNKPSSCVVQTNQVIFFLSLCGGMHILIIYSLQILIIDDIDFFRNI